MEKQKLVAIALAAVFALLSSLHVVWAFGGKLASGAVIPVVDGKPALRPSMAATLVVAGLLAAAALVVLARAGIVFAAAPPFLASVACSTLGAILVIRGIGEFRLVGLFKSVRGTAFAHWDTWLYSPLALALGLGALWLATRPRPQ